MSDRPSVIFIAHRIPYPPNKGDKIRSWRMLERLTKKYAVHLACFVDDPADLVHEEFLNEFCESVFLCSLDHRAAKLKALAGVLRGNTFSLPFYHDARMKAHIDVLRMSGARFEIAFSTTMAQYIKSPVGNAHRIIEFCDADSEKWMAYARDAHLPAQWLYAREGRLLKDVETRFANWADLSLAISPQEAQLFNARPEVHRQIAWWGNGVDTNYFAPSSHQYVLKNQQADFIFCGHMDYRPNVDAMVNFVNNVWPTIIELRPSATLNIVGAKPNSAVQRLKSFSGVSVIGRVDDVRGWMNSAKIVLAPMMIARGVQNKILEAMAMAKPIIASVDAADGLDLKSERELLIAKNNDELAAAALHLLHDRDECERLASNARAAALRRFQWNAQLDRFETLLESVVSQAA